MVRVAAESEGEAEALRRTLGSLQEFIDAQEAARLKAIEMLPDLEVRIWHPQDDEDSS